MTDKEQGRARRVLLARALPSAPDRVWLDRLCHGLLSWSRSRGRSQRVSDFPLLMVLLENSLVERIYLWESTDPFPWANLREAQKHDELSWEILVPEGEFSTQELKEGKSFIGTLNVWHEETALQWESGASI